MQDFFSREGTIFDERNNRVYEIFTPAGSLKEFPKTIEKMSSRGYLNLIFFIQSAQKNRIFC